MWAHPRAGGENICSMILFSVIVGSSPRGRGKLLVALPACDASGLIPARAGKTAPSVSSSAGAGAHPRAGGENGPNQPGNCFSAGSSPRGRGKLRELSAAAAREGLIPARAGKTPKGPRP